MAQKGDKKVKLIIRGEQIYIDLYDVASIDVSDMDREMDEVSAAIAHFGEYLGSAKGELTELDGEYRQWFARTSIKLKKEDPKLSDTKNKQHVEASDKFLQFKKAKAVCERNVEVLYQLVAALKEKSANLRSRGAWLRAEFNSQGQSTPERTRSSVADHKAGVRSGRKKGRKTQ